jgi:hypothetical protein
LTKKNNEQNDENQNNIGQDNLEIIMADVLDLLNIKVSYNERLSQINNIINQMDANYPELNLNILSSTLNYDQINYVITPEGIKNSKRDAKDGIVLFGYDKNYKMNSNLSRSNSNSEIKKNLEESDEFILNDFVFPSDGKKDTSGLNEFPNFAIYFNVDDKNYYIKDFKTGVGALMKIKKFTIEGSTLVNIGSNYLVINIEKNKIIIKIFNNTILENKNMKENKGSNCEIKEFYIKYHEHKLITIGRNEKCDVVLEDAMLSKVHSCIEYEPKDKLFYLYDGDKNRESTNGTWVFILNSFKITDNFLFKAERTLFMANLTNNK